MLNIKSTLAIFRPICRNLFPIWQNNTYMNHTSDPKAHWQIYSSKRKYKPYTSCKRIQQNKKLSKIQIFPDDVSTIRQAVQFITHLRTMTKFALFFKITNQHIFAGGSRNVERKNIEKEKCRKEKCRKEKCRKGKISKGKNVENIYIEKIVHYSS